MGNVFAGSEVVEMGIEIEKNGKDFYETLAKQSKNDKAKEIFQFLTGEEAKHIVDFKKVLDIVHKYEPPESYPGEYFAYLQALASVHVFTQKGKGVEAAKKATSDKEAIIAGIGFERDSIVFYDGMKKVVPESSGKVIDELIAQEKAHLLKLYELKEYL
ncbi:MAG: ferritin family protein [Candidatus Omnitrophica bacterium]|nr:ferritin family protein [Candidatus Omnitrophota bacterium]